MMGSDWRSAAALFDAALQGAAQPWVIGLVLALTTLLLEDLAAAGHELPRKIGILQEHCDTVGRDISEIEFSSEQRVKDLATADELRELAPVETVLAPEANEPAGTMVPVRLSAQLTEVGVLELWALSRDGKRRWKLEYNVRERPAGVPGAAADSDDAGPEGEPELELKIGE